MPILKNLTDKLSKMRQQGKPLPSSITLNYSEYQELINQANEKFGYDGEINSLDSFMGVKIILTIGENTHGTNNI